MSVIEYALYAVGSGNLGIYESDNNRWLFGTYHAINNRFLCLMMLLLLPLQSNTLEVSSQKNGTLVGSIGFVDETETTSLGDAANVTVELEHKGQLIPLVSNDLGDYIVELAAGTYDLKSARSAEGKELRFSSSQHKCFKVEPGKTTRFDVVLLTP